MEEMLAATAQRGWWETHMKPDNYGGNLVWVVMRREANGPFGQPVYHLQGIAIEENGVPAEQLALKMCRDATYFIFPYPLNTLLPENVVQAVGLYWPLKAPGVDARRRLGGG